MLFFRLKQSRGKRNCLCHLFIYAKFNETSINAICLPFFHSLLFTHDLQKLLAPLTQTHPSPQTKLVILYYWRDGFNTVCASTLDQNIKKGSENRQYTVVNVWSLYISCSGRQL